MLLTVDIGNSHIALGGYEGETLIFVANMVSESRRTADQYAVELLQLMALYHADPLSVDGVIISSVVPELCAPLQAALSQITHVTPMLVGPGVKTGLNILIDNPAQLGADLVAGAVAAIAQYPLPCAIFDLGTATTVSVIDKQGRFLGVIICAGLSITLEALITRTALLPHVGLEPPLSLIGKTTSHAMQSGLFYGSAAMLDGIAARLEAELGEPPTLIATGGLSAVVTPYCSRPFLQSEHLLFEGLRLVFEKNHKPRGFSKQ